MVIGAAFGVVLIKRLKKHRYISRILNNKKFVFFIKFFDDIADFVGWCAIFYEVYLGMRELLNLIFN